MSANSRSGSPKHEPRPISSRASFLLGGIAVAVIAVIVVLGVNWPGEKAVIRNDGYGTVHDQAVKVSLTPDGVIRLGKPDTRKTIDLYEDPLCPACGQLEYLFGQEIAQAIDNGRLAVRYHLVDFLNPKSDSHDYSTRGVAANQCVAAAGNAIAFAKFHAVLFTGKQPAEDGSDHSNQDLAAIAKEAGATDPAVQCITRGAKVSTAGQTAAAAKKSLTDALGDPIHTPAALDDGREIDTANAEWVAEQVK